RLIIDSHDTQAFAPIAQFTVGSFRDFLLSDAATTETLKKLSRGITAEIAAAVSKVMRNQDLILVAKKCEGTTALRDTGVRAGRGDERHACSPSILWMMQTALPPRSSTASFWAPAMPASGSIRSAMIRRPSAGSFVFSTTSSRGCRFRPRDACSLT